MTETQNKDTMHPIILIAVLATIPISMISGLFVGVWGAIWAIFICFSKGIKIKDIKSYVSPIDHLVILFCMISIIWSLNPAESILNFSKILSLILLSRIIYSKRSFLAFERTSLMRYFSIAFFVAVIIFLIEIYSLGVITITFKNIFQSCKEHVYGDHWLDRGICVLAISSWALIYFFWKNHQNLFSLITYLITSVILFMSDSTSAQLAYLSSGILAVALGFSNLKIYRFFVSMLVVTIFITPLIAHFLKPQNLPDEFNQLPVSHIHRLYIWKFVADKSMDRAFLGHGLGTSKTIQPPEEYYGYYVDNNGKIIRLNPLPLHPHNNILQIFLELGLIGLVMFAIYVRHLLLRIENFRKSDTKLVVCGASAFITYFVIGMISFNMLQSWWMMVILLAVTLFVIAKSSGRSHE